jgi:hypothetical protein
MDKYYTAEDVSVRVHFYPVDGVQISVDQWQVNEWVEVVDSRFICDSFFEAMCDALTRTGMDWWEATELCFEWGIVEPEYEEA